MGQTLKWELMIQGKSNTAPTLMKLTIDLMTLLYFSHLKRAIHTAINPRMKAKHVL